MVSSVRSRSRSRSRSGSRSRSRRRSKSGSRRRVAHLSPKRKTLKTPKTPKGGKKSKKKITDYGSQSWMESKKIQKTRGKPKLNEKKFKKSKYWVSEVPQTPKRRGRPKGSKNKKRRRHSI